ncbi:MAG: bifunctional folylpolyglutamate synthase/dihydrofolate synthase [Clostridium sp.]|nr:bifunctional folylpolyglutamate synthase/dihydrofolate synthase [Clostridium sp.]
MDEAYRKTTEWLFGQLPMFSKIGAGAYKPGLDTAKALSKAFGDKHRKFKTIHIAGTNGKGSTSHMLASCLAAAGYKTGLYTSPHLVDFRERMRINGEMISEGEVVDFTERYRRMNLGCSPSFFELTTIMAFDFFARQNADIAVIETGLGGRLDTTNIITPILSIITNVSLEHTALLGDTIEQIAREKAGIMKPSVPVVIGEADELVRPVFAEAAAEAYAPITFAEDHRINCAELADGRYAFSLYPFGAPAMACDLEGEWQKKNALTAITALRLLREDCGLCIPDTAIAEGLADVQGRTGLQGRWMRMGENPEIICDTGHNPGAWACLAPRLAKMAREKTLRVVIGFANDKDVDSIFASLPKEAIYYLAQPDCRRARPSTELLEIARANSLQAKAYATVAEALAAAKADASPADAIFVGGSNFVVAEAL